uniref:Uncharacterized protein n=1 Tax=Physcomitrium patens TaxID=3218 RepID=A0A2K1IXI5_PHYPA|nr:hypothetical protein PHYPA_023800 [Physcomitrium patens]
MVLPSGKATSIDSYWAWSVGGCVRLRSGWIWRSAKVSFFLPSCDGGPALDYVCFLLVLRGKQRCSHPVCVWSKERRLVCPSIVWGSCNVKCGVVKAVRPLMLESGCFPVG